MARNEGKRAERKTSNRAGEPAADHRSRRPPGLYDHYVYIIMMIRINIMYIYQYEEKKRIQNEKRSIYTL